MKLDNFKLEYNPTETKEFGVTDYMLDALTGVPAGLEDMAHGAYNLGDFLAFDTLPNWDEERFFARPKTLAGDLSAGFIQYALPFGFIGKGLSKAGKLTKALTKGKKPGAFTDLNVKGYLAADVATNFVAFDGQQERLSNLLKEIDNPALNNAVTQYLAADPDDSELEGRMKNVLEGVMLDAGLGALFKMFSVSLKASKRYVKEIEAGADKKDAITTAIMQYQDDTKGLNIVGDIDSQLQFDKQRAETDELYRMVGGDPEDIPEVDLSTVNWDEIDLEDVAEVAPRLSREELETLEAGGKLINEQTTSTGIVKTYELPSGSKRTVMVDINDPERVIAADVAFAPKGVADLDATYGQISPALKKDFYDKTLVEQVSKRMQTGKPMTAREALQDLNDRTNGNLGEYSPIVKKLLALGDETGIDARIEERSFASNIPEVASKIRGSFYDSEGRRIVLDAQDSSVKNNPVYNLLHESTHAVTVDNVIKHYDRNAFGNIAIDDVAGRAAFIDDVLKQKDLPKPIAEMFRLFKKADGMRDEIAAKGKLVTTEGQPDLYWIKNPMEFMSMAFSDPQLQRALKGIQYTPKMTMWEKIVNTVKSFFGKGVSTDLADNIVSRVSEIAEMKLPTQRGRGIDMMAGEELEDLFDGFFEEPPLPKFDPKKSVEFNKTVNSFVEQATAKGVRIGGKAAVKGVVKDLVKLTDGMTAGDLAALQDAIADKLLKEGTAIKKLTKESLEEGGIAEFADLVGADGTVLDQFVEQAAKDTITLNRVMSRMAAMQELMEANGQEILNVAKQFKEAKTKMTEDELQMMEGRLKGLVEQQLHIQAGHSSLASGFGRGLKSRQMRTQMSLSTDELQNKQVREEFLSKKGGMTMDQLVEGILIAEKNGGGDLFNTLIGVNKQVRGGHGGKMMDMVQEYYKNSLMWGPRTLTINALGTGLSNVWKNFERSIGGWVGADEATRRAVSNQWGETTSFVDAWKFLLNAWETGDQFIGDAGSAFVENSKSSIGSITGDNVQKVLRNVEISDGMKEAIDMFGSIIRFPNRFNTSVDQFYKFVQYKGRALSELKLKAYDLGIRDPEKVAEYVHDTFESLVTRSNRNFSESALFREAQEVVQGPFQNPAARQKAIADYVRTEKTNKLNKAREAGLIEGSLDDDAALRELTKNWIDPNIKVAEEVTFSGQLGDVGQKVQNLVTAMPGGFLIAPFVRTPTNILKFSYDRISAPARAVIDRARASDAWAKLEPEYRQRIDALRDGLKGSEKYRKTILEQLNARKPDGSPDRIARAEARGKVAMGTALNASLFYAIHNFADNITGGGPSDYKQKQAWLASGKLPYSIKFGDTWVSYQRLDPLATVIGIYADYKDLSEDNKIAAANSEDLDKLMAVTFELGVRNVTDKSYLAGVNKILKMLAGEGTPGKVLGGVAGGFIPNIIPQGASIAGDQHMKEARSFADVVLKRIPGMDVDLKRNPLGEPVVIQQFEGAAGILNPLNPLAWGFDKDDKVAKELANVAHGFSPPSTKIAGVIELTDFIGANGRSAYDRMLDLQSKVVLNGMTQRQALTKLINDKRYRSLDPTSFVGLPSERVKYITRILSRYKKAAQNQMLREFPEILQMKEQVEGSVRSGVSREDVLALLTQ